MSPADLTRDFGFLGTWSPRTGSQEYPGGQNDSVCEVGIGRDFSFQSTQRDEQGRSDSLKGLCVP